MLASSSSSSSSIPNDNNNNNSTKMPPPPSASATASGSGSGSTETATATTATAAQQRTFTRWVNAKLALVGYTPAISDLATDLQDGLALLALVKALAPPPASDPHALAPERQKTVLRIHQILNVGKALKHVANVSGSPLPMVGPEDIVDGNLKLTLGLVWGLIVRFQLSAISFAFAAADTTHQDDNVPLVPAENDQVGGDDDKVHQDQGQDQDQEQSAAAAAPPTSKPLPPVPTDPQQALLQWVTLQLKPYTSILPTDLYPPANFASNWQSGHLFLALAYAIRPTPALLDLAAELGASSTSSPVTLLTRAFELAHTLLGIPQLLDPDDVVAQADEKSIVTYVSSMYLAANQDASTLPEVPASLLLTHRASVASLATSSTSPPSTPVLLSSSTSSSSATLAASDLTPAARDLRLVAGELAALRRAIKRVAVDYPELGARHQAIEAATRRLDDKLRPQLDQAVEAVQSEGLGVWSHLAEKAKAYADDCGVQIKRAAHGCAVERLIQDFYEDCDACHAWLKDSSLALAVQTQKAQALTSPPPSSSSSSSSSDQASPAPFTTPGQLADLVATTKDLDKWIQVMTAHLTEFTATLDSLGATARNIQSHVGDSSRFADAVAQVQSRESQVTQAWSQFKSQYEHLQSQLAPSSLAHQVADMAAQVVHAVDDLDGIRAELGAQGGDEAVLAAKLEQILSQVHAWRADARVLSPELVTQHPPSTGLLHVVTRLEADVAAVQAQLASQGVRAKQKALVDEWATVGKYAAQVKDNVAQLTWKLSVHGPGGDLLDGQVASALAASAQTVATTAATLAGYEARVVRKLEARSRALLSASPGDAGSELAGTMREALATWKEAMAAFAHVRDGHALNAWVVDALRQLARVEARVAQVAEVVAVQAGKRRSVLAMVPADWNAAMQAGSGGDSDKAKAGAGGGMDLAGLVQTVADVTVDLDQVLVEYPEIGGMEAVREEYERVASKLEKARKIIDTLGARRAAAARMESITSLVSQVSESMSSITARLAMARADLLAVPDPLASAIDADSQLTPLRTVLTGARDQVTEARQWLAQADGIRVKGVDVVSGAEDEARALVDQADQALAECVVRLREIDTKLDKVREVSRVLDEAERALRLVRVADSDNASSVAKAGELLATLVKAQVPSVVAPRYSALDQVHKLFATYLDLITTLSNQTSVELHVHLDKINAHLPTRDQHAKYDMQASAAREAQQEASDQVSAWVHKINEFVSTPDSDNVAIFGDQLKEAKQQVMQLAMDAADAVDQRQVAIELVLRVIETGEAAGKLRLRVSQDSGAHGAETAKQEVAAWMQGAEDLIPLFAPLQASVGELETELRKLEHRVSAVKAQEDASQRLDEIETGLVPSLAAMVAQARDAVEDYLADMYLVPQATAVLLPQVADQVVAAVQPVQVELVDDRFATCAESLALVKSKLDQLIQDAESLRKLGTTAHAYVSAAAAVHALSVQAQAAIDAVSPAPDCAVNKRSVEMMRSELQALKSSHAGIVESSVKMGNALDQVHALLKQLDEDLDQAATERHVRGLHSAFESQADAVMAVVNDLQSQLTKLLDARSSSTSSLATQTAAELAALDEIAGRLESIKSDISSLVSLGSGHPELSGTVYAANIKERENSIQLSLSALLELHTTVTSTKQHEHKVGNWHVRCSEVTSRLSGLLDQFKKIDVNLDNVDAAQQQVAHVQDALDATLADVAVLKKEGHGDVTTLSTLAMLLSRKSIVVQQSLTECIRVRDLMVAATKLTEDIESCASQVTAIDALDQLEPVSAQVEAFDESLKHLVESEAMYVIANEANSEMVNMLFNELQRSLTALTLGVDARRKMLEQSAVMSTLRVQVDEFVAKIRAGVVIEPPAAMARDSYATIAKSYNDSIRRATATLEGMRETYDSITASANASLEKLQSVAPLQALLAEVSGEWTRARESIKQHAEKLGATTSLGELFARLDRVSGEVDRILELVKAVQDDTTEAGMATVQQVVREFTPLKEETAMVVGVFNKLRETHAGAIQAHLAGFEAFSDELQARVDATHKELTATQAALFKASQLLASCAELQEQCEVILETATERQETLANDLFYSMELVDAELFVKAALTVHQNATGDVARLRALRERLAGNEVSELEYISASFKERVASAIDAVDDALARLDAATKSETDQIDTLKRVYSHMRATQQIVVWLAAARGALATLTTSTSATSSGRGPVLQLGAVEEIRGKMVNFAPTIDMYTNMAAEVVAAVDHEVIRSRTLRVTTEWDELNARVDQLAKRAVEETLVVEFHALCDEMEEVMQMYRREVQTISRDAEQIDNEDEHEEMTRKLRQFGGVISETLDPQVERLNTILGSEQVTDDVVSQEELKERHAFVVNQIQSLQELVTQRIDLIQATQQTKAAFEIFGEISKLMASSQSLLDEIRVDQVALLDIDRTVAAVQQRHSHYANNINRLFEMVNRMPLREQVVARRDLLQQQWEYVGQDVAQMVRDLELRKKLLLARMEREREDQQSAMSMRGGGSKSPAPTTNVRSFLPRPTTPGQSMSNGFNGGGGSGLPAPSRLPTPSLAHPTPISSSLRPKTPPASKVARSHLRTPPPPMPTSNSRLLSPSTTPRLGSSNSLSVPNHHHQQQRHRSTTPTPPHSVLVSTRSNATPRHIYYRPDPHDAMDTRVAEIINDVGAFVKIKRQGPGKYMFGDIEGKVINCKLVNNNVVVRVGGGWKDLREYLLELDVANLIVKSETVTASRISYAVE
ncbi:hypothetical protein BCR44DRAFT_147184 [Catenaria anguillulae PL171]|uniref:Calponin homology domain-containing protein n=1 Tax=Catenaria anguillulae PL171 TaxID=765915 RepID=A0A1Y2HQT2_9FUNG|nr:hypothetical protein BCR44DRAFT_147184 [Catenaria anguillulae PL171]